MTQSDDLDFGGKRSGGKRSGGDRTRGEASGDAQSDRKARDRDGLARAVAVARRAAAKSRRGDAATPLEPNDEKAGARAESTTYGFSQAASCAKTPLRAASGRRGVADHRLITRWAEIVGPRLAKVCRPVRIKHRGGLALGGVLVIAARRAEASEIEHEAETLKERVNAFFGYRAAAEVKITQLVDLANEDAEVYAAGDAAATARAQARAADGPTLDARKRRTLEKLTEPVEDDALKAALQRLGANVMGRPKPEKRGEERDGDAAEAR